jgi:hypothetical protein
MAVAPPVLTMLRLPLTMPAETVSTTMIFGGNRRREAVLAEAPVAMG